MHSSWHDHRWFSFFTLEEDAVLKNVAAKYCHLWNEGQKRNKGDEKIRGICGWQIIYNPLIKPPQLSDFMLVLSNFCILWEREAGNCRYKVWPFGKELNPVIQLVPMNYIH